MPDYGSSAYWDERYSADDTAVFDWYQTYDTLRPLLQRYLSRDPDFEVLVPGCGNSSLSSDLYKDGYQRVCASACAVADTAPEQLPSALAPPAAARA